MNILFTKNKELIITKPGKLYWKENLVDHILFLLPSKWNDDLDLSLFTWNVRYVDPSNVAHMEILELKKDIDLNTIDYYSTNFDNPNMPLYLQYVLPIDTKLSNMAGIINLQLHGMYYNAETGEQYVIHSGSIGITISALEDYYAMTSDDSLNAIDQKILQLNNAIAHIDNVQKDMEENVIPNDLLVDSDSVLHLSVGGVSIGDGVEILTSLTDVNTDDKDGIIDIDDNIPEDIDISPIPQGVAIIDL